MHLSPLTRIRVGIQSRLGYGLTFPSLNPSSQGCNKQFQSGMAILCGDNSHTHPIHKFELLIKCDTVMHGRTCPIGCYRPVSRGAEFLCVSNTFQIVGGPDVSFQQSEVWLSFTSIVLYLEQHIHHFQSHLHVR